MTTREPIAVVGVSALFPGSVDRQGFWSDILAGKDLLSDVPASHWLIDDYYDADPKARDKTYARRGGFLPKVDFDPMAWGVPPAIVPATDTTQLLALVVARRVLEDACAGQFEEMDKSRVSVILGVTSAQELLGSMVSRLQKPVWVKALREMGLAESQVQEACGRIADHYVEWEESTFPGILGNVVAGRIANRLNLGGTNCVTDAACASTFSAISMAINELHLHQSDLAIAGGADTMNDIFMYMCFSKTPALSPTEDCRPFSDKADGTMLGEGLGMVALKRLSDAHRDGNRIYALLKGLGASSDGRAKSVYAPVAAGQAQAITRAYEQAGFSPASVGLIEAHGTGTSAGDAAEFVGLCSAFAAAETGVIALGSVKSQIGHTKAAAGAAGLFKAVMALHHKILPPTIKVDRPNPVLNIETTPFYLNSRTRPWIAAPGQPRRAGVSSFGFGGSNFHLALEEYVAGPPGEAGAPPAKRLRHQTEELVLLHGTTIEALVSACSSLHQECAAGVNSALIDEAALSQDPRCHRQLLIYLAWKTQLDFDAEAVCRLSITCSSLTALGAKLEKALGLLESGEEFHTPDGVDFSDSARSPAAFLFSGQGSQRLYMGADLAMAYPAARRVWDRLQGEEGEPSLARLVFPPAAFTGEDTAAQDARLTATENAQPALGAVCLAELALLNELGVRADAHAGHSFGEVCALHAAGVLSAAELMKVARLRGGHMAEAARLVPGAMTSVEAGADPVQQLVDELRLTSADAGQGEGHLTLANYNAPTLQVVSGGQDAIGAFERACESRGWTYKRLPVSTAFHSPVVAGACAPFAESLADIVFQAPQTPVYDGSGVCLHGRDPGAIRDALVAQIAQPIRFAQLIDRMYDDGIRLFVEVGAGAVLSGLVSRILHGRPHQVVPLQRKNRDGATMFQRALAKLSAAGHAVDFSVLWDDYAVPEDPRTIAAPAFVLKLDGASYNKPYPPAGGSAALPGPNPEPAGVPQSAESRLDAAHTARSAPQIGVQGSAVPAPTSSSVADQEVGSPVLAMVPPASDAADASSLPGPGHQRPVDAAAGVGQPTQPPPLSPAASGEWLAAFQAVQQQALQTHLSYQKLMAESHRQFLAASEACMNTLAAGVERAGAGFVEAPQAMAEAGPVSGVFTGVPDNLSPGRASGPDLAAGSQPIRGGRGALQPARASAGTAVVGEAQVAPVGSPTRAADSEPASATTGDDIATILLRVVADKTGYPSEMVGLDMDLEADLGIDSIKRVEILSAVQSAADLPQLDPSVLATSRTLRQILDHLAVETPPVVKAEGSAVVQSEQTASGSSPGADPVVPTAVPADGYSIEEIERTLLQVVADKTGYPLQMVSSEADLESDLGIDSIKRVEILSAVQGQLTDLPTLDPTQLGGLRTLKQIVGVMAGQRAAGHSQPHSAAAVATACPSGPGFIEAGGQPGGAVVGPGVESGARAEDLGALLLRVVADKTGYPVEMVSVEADLEADLGIDSIKRVEILSAVQAQLPDLGDLDPAELSTARTLQHILDRLSPADKSVANVAQSMPGTAAAALQPARPGKLLKLGLLARPAAAPGFAAASLFTAQRIVVCHGPKTLRRHVCDRLRAAGVAARVLPEAEPLPADADGVIALTGLENAKTPSAGAELHRRCFTLAAELAARTDDSPKLWVTVQDTGGDFGLGGTDRAWLAGFSALSRTAQHEWPACQVRALDIERGKRRAETVARAIVAELLHGAVELEVGLSQGGERVVAETTAVDFAADHWPEHSRSDVVVVSGGARGITAQTVVAMARQAPTKFLLLGRTVLTGEPTWATAVAGGGDDDGELKAALLAENRRHGRKQTPVQAGREVAGVLALREIRATLVALAELGSAAEYVSVDVLDGVAMRQAIAAARQRFGPITGIVHGAGVLADKRIRDKSPEQFDRVFSTKVLGLQHLLRCTSEDPLSSIVLFSSVAARLGNVGQCDYAMANEVLNKVAALEQRRRGPSCIVRALGWGPWAGEGGMVSPALRQQFESRGVGLLPVALGCQVLLQEQQAVLGTDERPVRSVEMVVGFGESAAHLLPLSTSHTRQLALIVHGDELACVADHRVQDTPVLPLAMAADWMMQAAQRCRPDLQASRCRSVAVLKGIILPDFATAPTTFLLNAEQVANGADAVIEVQLSSLTGQPHYRATVEMAAQLETGKPAPSVLTPEQWTRPIYGDILFHGPQMQSVVRVHGFGNDGLRADLVGGRQLGWSERPWRFDPALTDGAMQLALLWSSCLNGGKALPTGIDEVVIYTPPTWGSVSADRLLAPKIVNATLIGKGHSGPRVTADIWLADETGEPLAYFGGVQTHTLMQGSALVSSTSGSFAGSTARANRRR